MAPQIRYKDSKRMNKPKGKNFSTNNASGKRRKSDFYETPYSLTQLLLDKVRLTGSILEPACGNNAIVNILTKHGYSDITYYDKETNFLTETKHYDTIITNPPYSISYEFIQHAKTISNDMFFLLPLSYLHGKKRYDTIYTDTTYPLKEVCIFTRYPLLGESLNNDGSHNTGMMVYAWYWFSKSHTGCPVISWLDNDPYIIRKSPKNNAVPAPALALDI